MTALSTLLSEARARGMEPDLVDGFEKLIADLSLLTPHGTAGYLQDRWGIRSEDGRPWKEPGELDWMDIDGHRWASDGAIAFREDAPRPLWRRHADPREPLPVDFVGYRNKAQEIREWLEQACPPGEWAEPAAFSPRFAPLFREHPATPSGLKFRMGACRRDGEIIALVMPLRRGCRGVGPDGLPVAADGLPVADECVAAEEAPAETPAGGWTDTDAKRLRSLQRKRRRQLKGSPTRLSDGDSRELSELKQKRKRRAQ